MFLILGEPEDLLAGAVHRHLEAAGHRVCWLGEAELAEATPFALLRDGTRFSGFLRCRGEEVRLADLAGVLVRLPRRWWPAPEFDSQDQFFVYHETTAALFSLLAGLDCPVVNRFGLGWWLNDTTYRERLLAGLPGGVGALSPDGEHRTGSLATETVRVYLAGRQLIAGMPETEELAAGSVAAERQALSAWQRSTGIALCRLDLRAPDDPAIVGLDVAPALAEEPPDLVRRLAAATAELLS